MKYTYEERMARRDRQRKREEKAEEILADIHDTGTPAFAYDFWQDGARDVMVKPANTRLRIASTDRSAPWFGQLHEWEEFGATLGGSRAWPTLVSKILLEPEAVRSLRHAIEHHRYIIKRAKYAETRAEGDARMRERFPEVWAEICKNRAEVDAMLRKQGRSPLYGTAPADITALRRKVQDTHPDRGGNAADFHKAKQALDAARGR